MYWINERNEANALFRTNSNVTNVQKVNSNIAFNGSIKSAAIVKKNKVNLRRIIWSECEVKNMAGKLRALIRKSWMLNGFQFAPFGWNPKASVQSVPVSLKTIFILHTYLPITIFILCWDEVCNCALCTRTLVQWKSINNRQNHHLSDVLNLILPDN